jgi:hypothetical protein
MTKFHCVLAIPAPEMPIGFSSKNLELRLLPYWKGVKHFRTSRVSEQITPQDYYWTIVSNNQNPTQVNGKVIAFNSRADMYFSRIPPSIATKLWQNFGINPHPLNHTRRVTF